MNPLTMVRDLFHGPPTPGVLGVFGHLDATVDAVKQLQAGGRDDYTVYSPLPRHELEDAIGAWLTLYMSNDWPVQVGGKPIGSIPPYVVIMFEMTVLFGALNTLLGVALNALRGARRRGTIAYDPRFTNDKFGIFVPAQAADAGKVEALLKGAGAEEVRRA
ncbi:MAG TPA: DUF3341 domain-containing protein [Gemmatimonadales bacterium]|nr:DUF3341 domain-containing protein [Gemmatimonadales bacterium]